MSAVNTLIAVPHDANSFTAWLWRNIPMTAALRLRVQEITPSGLALAVPLAGNHNDKATAFAGALSTAVTLAGWAVVSWQCWQADLAASVVVFDAHTRYQFPVTKNFVAHASWDMELGETFLQQLRTEGKAKIAVKTAIFQAHRCAVQYHGHYAARLINTPNLSR
jgi:thioesterase domain-containing protein